MSRITTRPSAAPHATRACPTAAQQQAQANWLANLRALARTQPSVLRTIQTWMAADIEWVYARDGSLTAREGGRWHSGCSLPRRAALTMLAKTRQQGITGCFLAPTHAAQIEQALVRLDPQQAMIILQPDMRIVWIALHCCDFAADILAHRLWLATGENWTHELARVLADNLGLPIPQQSLRTALLNDEQAAALMNSAQRVMSDESQRRAAMLREICARSRPAASARLCIIGPSRFRLWSDEGAVLFNALGPDAQANQMTCIRFDSDDPASSSPLALAMAGADCSAVVAANLTRADLAAALPDDLPLITWATRRPMPPFGGNHADGLLVADRAWIDEALAAQWAADRVAVAAWPTRGSEISPAQPPFLAIIADTIIIDTAPEFDLSTHGLLWDAIRNELLRDPLALGSDIAAYLKSRMLALGIQEQGFDAANFIENLILPAYQQGLARMLISAGLPLKLHGHGWSGISDLAGNACGPIGSPAQLESACQSAAALVYTWPDRGPHPIDAFARPVIRPAGDRGALLDQARSALAGKPQLPQTRADALSLSAISRMIGIA